jgi:hypothetical protein
MEINQIYLYDNLHRILFSLYLPNSQQVVVVVVIVIIIIIIIIIITTVTILSPWIA